MRSRGLFFILPSASSLFCCHSEKFKFKFSERHWWRHCRSFSFLSSVKLYNSPYFRLIWIMSCTHTFLALMSRCQIKYKQIVNREWALRSYSGCCRRAKTQAHHPGVPEHTTCFCPDKNTSLLIQNHLGIIWLHVFFFFFKTSDKCAPPLKRQLTY